MAHQSAQPVLEQIEANLLFASKQLREYGETLSKSGLPGTDEYQARLLDATQSANSALELVTEAQRLSNEHYRLKLQVAEELQAWKDGKGVRAQGTMVFVVKDHYISC